MPTPLDLLLDPATQVLFALFGGLLLWELVAPARRLPKVRGWTLRALAAFALYFLLSSYLPLLWAETLAPLRLFDLAGWPTWAAVAAGVLGYELGAYAGTARCIPSRRCGGCSTRCTTARSGST